MTNILLCTGKKKAVEKVMDFFKDLNRKKTIEILELQVCTKRVMMMRYEELKLLFVARDEGRLKIPRELAKKADLFKISQGQRLMMRMKTFETEDPSLRWNIMSQATAFKLNGGDVRLEETVIEQNYKKIRSCSLMIAGPPKMALDLKDQLVRDRIVDPKSVQYTI